MTTIENTIPRLVYQCKNGKAWMDMRTVTDPADIYESLAVELVAKKINACLWVKSITRKQKYTHVEITVTYDNGNRAIYYLKATSF